MFPKATFTKHKNKSYRFEDGGYVLDDPGFDASLKRIRGMPEGKRPMSEYQISDSAQETRADRSHMNPEGSGRFFRNPFRSSESKATDAIDDAAREGRAESDRKERAQRSATGSLRAEGMRQEIADMKRRREYLDTPPRARK